MGIHGFLRFLDDYKSILTALIVLISCMNKFSEFQPPSFPTSDLVFFTAILSLAFLMFFYAYFNNRISSNIKVWVVFMVSSILFLIFSFFYLDQSGKYIFHLDGGERVIIGNQYKTIIFHSHGSTPPPISFEDEDKKPSSELANKRKVDTANNFSFSHSGKKTMPIPKEYLDPQSLLEEHNDPSKIWTKESLHFTNSVLTVLWILMWCSFAVASSAYISLISLERKRNSGEKEPS